MDLTVFGANCEAFFSLSHFRSNDKSPLFSADDPTPAYVNALINWNKTSEIFSLVQNWIQLGEVLNCY